MAEDVSKKGINAVQWYLEFDGIADCSFSEVTGLESSSEIIEQIETMKDGKRKTTKIPGNEKYGNITMRRGISDNKMLQDWRKDVEEGKVDKARKNGSLVLYTQDHTELCRFNFINAWPVKLKISGTDASKNEVLVEEVEICHEGLTRA